VYLVDGYQRFEGAYCFHLHGGNVTQVRNQRESGGRQGQCEQDTEIQCHLTHHSFPVEEYIVGFEVFTAVKMEGTVLLDITPCNLVLFPAHWFMVSCSYPSILKMEAICSSEMSDCL
jgi:hypothetical protein